MKNFRVQIRYHGHYADFTIVSEDNAKSIEQSILDKLGEKSVKWESTGMFRNVPRRITYEEVNHDRRPIQTKKVLGVEMAVGV